MINSITRINNKEKEKGRKEMENNKWERVKCGINDLLGLMIE